MGTVSVEGAGGSGARGLLAREGEKRSWNLGVMVSWMDHGESGWRRKGHTGMELTLMRATWVGKKSTSPLARALLKAVQTSSGKFAGILTGAMPSGGADIMMSVLAESVLQEERKKETWE